MAVPANPTLTQVCAEFLAPSNTPLSHFRRGAGWVPDIPVNANVPTGFPIHLSQLAGSMKVQPAVISNWSIYHGVTAGTARAGYRLQADGQVRQRKGGVYSTLETWLPGGASASSYGVIVNLAAGSALESGTLGALLQLNTDHEWVLARGTLGLSASVLSVSLCAYPSGTVFDTATINLDAERETPE